jgi:anti-sigma factor RsiW
MPLGCPEIECWDALLDVSLSAEEARRLEEHVRQCPLCQERMDRG